MCGGGYVLCQYWWKLVARRAYCVGVPQIRMCVRPTVRPCVRPCVCTFFVSFLERQNADTTRETLQKGSRKWSIFAHILIWGSDYFLLTFRGSEDRDITSCQWFGSGFVGNCYSIRSVSKPRGVRDALRASLPCRTNLADTNEKTVPQAISKTYVAKITR